MPAIPIAMAATSIYSAVKGADTARKAANQAADAAKNAGVNIPQVAQMAQDQAYQNAINSAALEKQLNPLAPQLRNDSIQSLLQQLGAYPQDNGGVMSSLLSQFNQSPQAGSVADSQLSEAARQRALAELQLGGQLPQDVANQIVRSSAAHAGAVGGGALGLGRDISARDLGLNSLQLLQQRLSTAGQFGAQQDQFNLARQNQLMNQQLQQQQLRQQLGFGIYSLGQQDQNSAYQRALAAAQLGQSIAQPVTGLDPSAIANLAVGNSNVQQSAAQNAAAIAAQRGQGQSQFGGQLLGMGLSGLNSYFNQPKVTTLPTTTVGTLPSSTPTIPGWSPSTY